MAVNPETLNPSGKKGKHHKGKSGGSKKWHPPKGVGGAVGGAGGAAAHAAGGSRHNVKKNRKKVRRVKHRNDKREERRYNRASQQSYLDYRKAEEKQIRQDFKQSDVESFNRATERAQRKVEKPVTKFHLSPNELDAAAWIVPIPGLKGPLAKPVIKVAEKLGVKGAERGAVKEGERIVEGKLAKKEAERVAVKREGEKVASKKAAGKAATKKADKQIAKNARKASKVKKAPIKSRVRSKATKFAKRHRPTVTAGKVAMKGAANERVRKTVIAGGIGGPVIAGPGAAVVQNTVEAAKEDPSKFTSTSLAGLGSLATAPIALGAAGYSTAKNLIEGKPDPLKPVSEQVDAYKDYLKDYPELANPGSEKARKMILRKYGATPVITGALGVQAATRLAHAGLAHKLPEPDDAPEPKIARQGIRPRRVSTLKKEAAQSTNADKAEAASRALRAAEKRRHAKRGQVAREYDAAAHRARAKFSADMNEKATVGGKTKTFKKSMSDLEQVPLGAKDYTAADAVQVVHAYGIPLDAQAGRAALIHVRESLSDPKVAVESPLSVRETRTVLDALIENPQILEHSDFKRTEIQLRAIRRDQAEAPTPPDPRDRARHVAQAREHGVPTPEEVVPHELRGKTTIKVKRYQNAYRRLRQQANQLAKRAARKEAQARVLPKDSPKRATLESEAVALRAKADEIRAVVNRPQKAKYLDRQAHVARKAGDLEAEAELRAQALDLRQQHQQATDLLDEEFHGRMANLRAGQGRREPIFFHDLRSYDAGETVRGGKPVAAAGAAKADKVKLGKLRDQGLVDESGRSLIESLYRDRANVEMNQALQRILGEGRKGRLLTGLEARNMVAQGKSPAGYSLIPLQDFKRAYARGEWEHALEILDEPRKVADMRDVIRDADFQGKGKKYLWIPTSTLDEVYAQAQGIGGLAKGLKAFGAAQSMLLLGTSPTWAFYQGFATPLTLAARHPNPVTWIKGGRDMVRLWRKFTPRERAAFAAQFGGNVGDITGHFKFDDLSPGFDQIRSLSDASKVARSTFMGKLLHSLSKGGPLIQGVAKYEAALRTMETLMEIDKLHGRTAVTKWVNSLADLDAATRKQIDTVAGMSFEERVRYFSDPENTKPIEQRVESALGNWTKMTHREKQLTGAFMFYPFMRFSLKWAFHTFPRDNPIKAAILLNLAQQNSDEVKHMLGGTPSFIQSFGLIPYRNQEGKVEGAINMSRAAPASNALVEQFGGTALSGEPLNLSVLGRVVQPALAAMILQGVGGLDPYTGEKVSQTTVENFRMAAVQLLGLNPITRAALLPDVKESSAVAQFYQQLDGRSPWEKSFVPQLTVTKSKERAKQQFSEWMRLAGEAPTPEQVGQMADYIAKQYPGYNQAQLREVPEIAKFIQVARRADVSQAKIGAALEAAGLGSDEEQSRTFKNLMTLVSPIGGFTQKPIDKRTEAQRVRFLKRNRGLTSAEIQRQYPGLPATYAITIERLRKQGMTDKQIAAKYPRLRKHLPSLSSGSGIGSNSIGDSSIGSSSIGSTSIGD